MKPKHTPGPWKCIESTIVNSAGDSIIEILSATQADKRLIIAAPELLEALREALSCIDSWTHDPVVGPIIETAKAVIAKAEGRES